MDKKYEILEFLLIFNENRQLFDNNVRECNISALNALFNIMSIDVLTKSKRYDQNINNFLVSNIRNGSKNQEVSEILLQIFQLRVRSVDNVGTNDLFNKVLQNRDATKTTAADLKMIGTILKSANFTHNEMDCDAALSWVVEDLRSEDPTLQQSCIDCIKVILFRTKTPAIWLHHIFERIRYKSSAIDILLQLLSVCNPIDSFDFIRNRDLWRSILMSLLNIGANTKPTCALIRLLLSQLHVVGQEIIGNDLLAWSPDKSSEMLESWDALLTIVKNLEENQSHLILPTLPLINKLKLIPQSWKFVVLTMILQHENTLVLVWGVNYMISKFQIKMEDCENEIFVLMLNKLVVDALNNTFLYSDDNISVPALYRFLQSIPPTLKKVLLASVMEKSYGSVSFYHLLNGLVIEDAQQLISVIDYNLQFTQNTHLRSVIDEKLKKQLVCRLHASALADDSTEFLSQICQLLEKQPILLLDLMVALRASLTNNHFSSYLEHIRKNNYVLAMKILQSVSPHLHESEDYLFELQSFVVEVMVNKNLKNLPAFSVVYPDLSIVDIQKFNNVFLGLIVENKADNMNNLKFISNISDVPNIYTTHGDIKQSHYDLVRGMTMKELHQKGNQNVYVDFNNVRLNLTRAGCDFYESDDLEVTIHLLEVGPSNVLISIMEMTQITIKNHQPQAANQQPHLIKSIIERCFVEIMALRKNSNFWKYIERFIELIFVNGLTNQLWTANVILETYQQLLTNASQIHGLGNILFSHLLKQNAMDLIVWPEFIEIFVSGITFGDIPKRDQRIEMETCQLVSGDDYKNICKFKSDALVRSACVSFLLKLKKAPATATVDTFIALLQAKLIAMFSEAAKGKPRYYANSQHHRLKLKILQFLIVLNKNDTADVTRLSEAIFYENDQPSVSYILEFFVATNGVLEDVLEKYGNDPELKFSGTQSLITVLWLMCCRANDKALSTKSINYLMKYTMGQNFSVRLYAQVAIIKLIEKFHTDTASISHVLYDSIKGAIEAAASNGNAQKSFKNLLNDFRFSSSLDFSNLLSLDNVFHHIPRITGMSDEEIVTFEMIKTTCEMIGCELEIKEDNSLLDAEKMACFKPTESTVIVEEISNQYDNVQTKMVPLRTFRPNCNMLDTLPDYLSKLKMANDSNGMIVVASLVSRAPNLGNLSRTSEIFGMEKFIVDNLKIIENKEFQALSVTSEKWLNISELKSWQLEDYLKNMKSHGYKIIGAEQTAKSLSFYDVKFPKKTVLLLGHEKEGIPANLLSLLDIAVEIPQYGVIRSLNVNVTGALFMMEYAKQHKFKCV